MNTLLQIIDDCVEFIKNMLPTGTEQYLMAIGAAIGLFISIAVGGMDKMIYALIALMVLDYTTGLIAAFRTGQWDSSTGFIGLAKKAVILAVVALCNTVDTAMDTHALRQMAICAYALNEAGSIIENVDRAGWGEHIPAFIRNALARLQSKQEERKMKVKKYNLHFTELSKRDRTDLIVIHHTGNPVDDDLSAEQIHASHQEQGWAGIGYHYVIRKDGTIERGRPENCIGAHAIGNNGKSIGIHICGNFEIAEPTEAQLNSLPVLIADICKRYGLIAAKNVIVGHRDLDNTACPGKNLYNKLDIIRGNAEWYRNH